MSDSRRVIKDDEFNIVRKEIIHMLKESFEIEYGKDVKDPQLRWWNMTQDEYRVLKKMSVLIFFGELKISTDGTAIYDDKVEGFGYSVPRLIREDYFQLKFEDVSYLPIPMSPKRWQWCMDYLVSKEELKDYYWFEEPGKLLYPLRRNDVVMIMKQSAILNETKDRLVCSLPNVTCEPINVSKFDSIKDINVLWDKDPEHRFGDEPEEELLGEFYGYSCKLGEAEEKCVAWKLPIKMVDVNTIPPKITAEVEIIEEVINDLPVTTQVDNSAEQKDEREETITNDVMKFVKDVVSSDIFEKVSKEEIHQVVKDSIKDNTEANDQLISNMVVAEILSKHVVS